MKGYLNKEELKAKYIELNSMKKVADFYNVSKKTILNYMNKFNIERNSMLLDIDVNKASEMFYSDMNIIDIAKEFKVCTVTIRTRLNQIGIDTDNYHKGYIIKDSGYMLIYDPNHPNCDKKGYVPVHRLVVEKHLGRILSKNEVVHHINKDKTNNNFENLQVLTSSEHAHIHSPEEKKVINIEIAKQMLDTGYKMPDVANYFKLSVGGLRNKLKRYGLYKPLPKGTPSHKKLL